MDIFKNTALKFKDKKEKEKLIDKYYKLKQNDQQTFTKLFNHCCLPVLGSNRTVIFLFYSLVARASQTCPLKIPKTLINYS